MLVKKKGIWCCLQMSTVEIVFCFCWYRQEKNILDNWYRNWKNPCMNMSRVLPLNVDIDRDILISTNFYMYWYFIVRMNFCRCQYRLQNCFLVSNSTLLQVLQDILPFADIDNNYRAIDIGINPGCDKVDKHRAPVSFLHMLHQKRCSITGDICI